MSFTHDHNQTTKRYYRSLFSRSVIHAPWIQLSDIIKWDVHNSASTIIEIRGNLHTMRQYFSGALNQQW